MVKLLSQTQEASETAPGSARAMSDLGVYQLATCISHVLPGLTEHGLMQIGRELYQARWILEGN